MKTSDIVQYRKEWYQTHKDYHRKYYSAYNITQPSRAAKLLYAYNQSDEQHNRGKGDLTAQWIVENIFSKPCVYCGETDWRKLGCNRIDVLKPHTMNNVEPCCWKCNCKLRGKDVKQERNKTVYQYTIDGELVNVWKSAKEAAAELKLWDSSINRCCNGKLKTTGGYIFSYNLMK